MSPDIIIERINSLDTPALNKNKIYQKARAGSVYSHRVSGGGKFPKP